MNKLTLERPNLIVKNGKPQAVILDLREYKQLLDLAEIKSDLSELKKIKKGRTSFRSIEEYAGGKL